MGGGVEGAEDTDDPEVGGEAGCKAENADAATAEFWPVKVMKLGVVSMVSPISTSWRVLR